MRSFSIITQGCQMNQHDSERIGELLVRCGYQPLDEPAQADIVIVNTCSVRDKAEHKLRSEVGRLGVTKRQRPELTIVVAGCVAQQEGEKLVRSLPQIDVIVGPDNIPELPRLLADVELGAPPQVVTEFDLGKPRFLSARPVSGNAAPGMYVTVMKGCDERCSFCIVPHTRGPERYRPAREIVDEVARLEASGAREVTLLGQTVNSYRDPERSLPHGMALPNLAWEHTSTTTAREDESEFPALLRAIGAGVPGLSRLRYASPHPRHLTHSLIAAHRELEPLVRHVHLPVQSGSDRVLRRMIRRYTVAEYLERVDALRAAVPGLTLSTDVIVGFPGETRADFEATLALVERVGFTGLFGFKYSPRPFTPALRLGDDISEDEKSSRLAELFELSEAQRQAHLASLVGQHEAVLVEGRGRDGRCTGRTERNEIVHFDSARDRTGEIVSVRIAAAHKHSLGGELLEG